MLIFISILAKLGHNSTEPEKPDENPGNKKTPWDWQKWFEVIKSAGSVASLILFLLKILQDLGLLP